MIQLFRAQSPRILFLSSLLTAGMTNGQDNNGESVTPPDSASFSLFGLLENVSRSTESARSEEYQERRRRAGASGEPAFTLLGTSRIGNRYSAILRHHDGTEIVLISRGENETKISGYEQYAMVGVESGRVSIRYPENAHCVEFSDAGVSCKSQDTAILELTTGDPLPRILIANPDSVIAEQRNPGQQWGNTEQSPVVDESTPSVTTRIDPADVPPGMVIFSTPFGDQLVPED